MEQNVSPPEVAVKTATRVRRTKPPKAEAAPATEAVRAETNAITRSQKPKTKPAAAKPAAASAPEIPDVIKRTQAPRRKPSAPAAPPSPSEQLKAFIEKSPEVVEVLEGTADAPTTIEMTRAIGNYFSSLVLSVESDSVIFGSMDMWHKINRKAENVYYETRAASVDEILVWLEGRYDEWRNRVNTSKKGNAAQDADAQPQ